MRIVLIATVCVLLLSGPAFGQLSSISVYSDPVGTNCLITDAAPGLLPIYAVHTLTLGASAIQFAAPMPACMTGAIHLSDTAQFPVTVGDSHNGVAIGYGACIAAPIHVLTINIFGAGISGICCRYPVVPDPNIPSGKIEAVDCADTIVYPFGGEGWVNSDGTCGCEPATEAATWGGIKAIYAN